MTESLVMYFCAFFCNELEIKGYLSCRHIFDSHIAENILITFSDIIREWGIPKEVIGKVLTDNGSNILKHYNFLPKIFCNPGVFYAC